jgi:hypothetical protein
MLIVGYGMEPGREQNRELLKDLDVFFFRHFVSTAWNFSLPLMQGKRIAISRLSWFTSPVPHRVPLVAGAAIVWEG